MFDRELGFESPTVDPFWEVLEEPQRYSAVHVPMLYTDWGPYAYQ
jgi:hypothetical protein